MLRFLQERITFSFLHIFPFWVFLKAILKLQHCCGFKTKGHQDSKEKKKKRKLKKLEERRREVADTSASLAKCFFFFPFTYLDIFPFQLRAAHVQSFLLPMSAHVQKLLPPFNYFIKKIINLSNDSLQPTSQRPKATL